MAFKTEHAKLMVLSEFSHIIGFAFFNISIGMESAGKYIWLNEMHIHKSYRSKGYGKVLLDELKKWCRENNIKRIMGMANDTDLRTLKFYKSNDADIYPQQILSMPEPGENLLTSSEQLNPKMHQIDNQQNASILCADCL